MWCMTHLHRLPCELGHVTIGALNEAVEATNIEQAEANRASG